MVQFLIGFWCGCMATILVGCIAFSNRIRQFKEEKKAGVEPKKEAQPEGVAGCPEGPCVLLVDDSKLSRTVLKELLGKHELDYDISEAYKSLHSI